MVSLKFKALDSIVIMHCATFYRCRVTFRPRQPHSARAEDAQVPQSPCTRTSMWPV